MNGIAGNVKEMKERQEIVARYELGREEGAEIDAWEDPAFEVYHVTDHHGFIHPERVSEEVVKLDLKSREKKLNREKKWVVMTKDRKQWGKAVKTNKVAERTFKGIPEKVRGAAWCMMLDVKNTKAAKKDIYERMREMSKKWSPCVKQIDLDINRTFRDHIMFRKRYDIKQQALFNVLCAYSLYDEEVGYCQGMSEVAALILMFMNEEDAFWSLATMMTNKRHNMRGFFLPSFPKLMRFKDHHDMLIKKNFKKVKKHLDKNNINTVSYCIKWFMQCFLDRLPFSLTLRLWDIYVWEGEGLLTAMAYTIIRLQRDRLLKLSEEEILKFFQSDLPKNFDCDDEFAIKTLKLGMSYLRQSNNLIPARPVGSEGVKIPLASFVPPPPLPPEATEEKTPSTEHQKPMRRFGDPANSRVSIPADGGPEVGVEHLIEEDQSRWTSIDRYLSQDFPEDLLDKSDNSPTFNLRRQGDDGLSSCTSLASHDYDNRSLYEGDDDDDDYDFSGVVGKNEEGSPDTLNGSHRAGFRDLDNTCIEDTFSERFAIGDERESRSTSSVGMENKLPGFASASHLASKKTFSDQESLNFKQADKNRFYDYPSSYQTVPSLSTRTNNFASSKFSPGVPYTSATNHIAPLKQMTNQRMPYMSKSSCNVRNALSPPAAKFPDHPSGQVDTSGRFDSQRRNISSSTSYLGRKVRHRGALNDQHPAPVADRGVSIVVVGEETDFIIRGDRPESIYPTPVPQVVPRDEGIPSAGNGICFGVATRSDVGNASESRFTPGTSDAGDRRLRNGTRGASDSIDASRTLRRFVSSGPHLDGSLYHPDSRGVTRIWTGAPSDGIVSGSINRSLLGREYQQKILKASPYESGKGTDGKSYPKVFYTQL